mmetsp:Transcript_697/g.2163  ORF Transcript_697/g.2163 Transcript_697/m.2163 type:complete len:202 (-) Transcript_697:1650-2255(-)
MGKGTDGPFGRCRRIERLTLKRRNPCAPVAQDVIKVRASLRCRPPGRSLCLGHPPTQQEFTVGRQQIVQPPPHPQRKPTNGEQLVGNLVPRCLRGRAVRKPLKQPPFVQAFHVPPSVIHSLRGNVDEVVPLTIRQGSSASFNCQRCRKKVLRSVLDRGGVNDLRVRRLMEPEPPNVPRLQVHPRLNAKQRLRKDRRRVRRR